MTEIQQEWPEADWGEHVSIPAEAIAERPNTASDKGGEVGFLRQAGRFIDIEGQEYLAGLDEVEASPDIEPGRFKLFLHSHKKEIIVGGAALLFAAGAGASYALNRTQRKKMR